VPDRRFGVSTHLFHDHRLSREHLVDIAGHGFEAVEVFATRSHFDYRNPAAAAELAEWLADTRLQLHSVHAPIVEALRQGQWIGSFSTAAGDEPRRRAALAEIEATLDVARTVPFRYLVVHLGMPADQAVPPGDNQPDAARRSVTEIVELAGRVGVKVALEVIPNQLSSAASLTRLIEETLEDIDVGVCVDFGHAHLMGDIGEALEQLSGHVWTTHVHDNHGKRDDHLVPFMGTIDWDLAIMELQKVGYDDVLMLEVANLGDPIETLKRSAKARERLEKAFVTF
jgi:sugar phosphate isomerase/epimerase